MSNLYTQYNNNRPTTTGGSFDDYDSIVDEFSMPGYTDNNSNNNGGGGLSAYGIGRGGDDDQSDVSSMQMSELGGVSVAMENNHRGGGGVVRYNNNSPARSGISIATPTDIAEQQQQDNDNNNGVASPLQFLPSHLVATNQQNNNNGAPPPQSNLDVLNTSQSTSNSKNSTSFNIDVDESGYYHVGDYRMEGLGIDTTDVSAILGMQHSIDNNNDKLFDEESLLADAGSNITGVESGLVMKNKKSSSSGRGKQQQQTVGPLGDNMSYTGSNTPNDVVQHIAYDTSSSNNSLDEDEENEENYGILPNWIAFSSQRTKCIFVTSTAFVVSALVLAVVALGVSYGTGNFMVSPNSNENNGSSDSLVQPIPSDSGSGTGNFDMSTLINNSTKDEDDEEVDDNIGFGFNVVATTDSPSSSPIVVVPDISSSSPTLITPPVTSSATVTEPTTVFVSPTTPALPLSSSPTLKPITLTPSTSPVIVTGTPTTVLSPTIKPSTSSKPSWSYGTEANEAGDATFYLMADGGSNFQFWSDKLRSLNLDQDQKFVVHL